MRSFYFKINLHVRWALFVCSVTLVPRGYYSISHYSGVQWFTPITMLETELLKCDYNWKRFFLQRLLNF